MTMDEITLINLLNKICDKNPLVSWQLNCKYHDAAQDAIMEIGLFNPENSQQHGNIVFKMGSGKLISGKYKGMVPFQSQSNLTDILLDILYYENSKLLQSAN